MRNITCYTFYLMLINIMCLPLCLQEVTCLEDMLGIEPLDLHFIVEPNKQISCSVRLTNDTDDYFAFNVQTTNPKQYRIQPDRDVVPPRSERSVTIILLQEPMQAAQHNKRCMDELSVHSTRVDEGVTATDVNELLFTRQTDKVVDHVSLTVVFDMSPSPPEEQTEDFTFAPSVDIWACSLELAAVVQATVASTTKTAAAAEAAANTADQVRASLSLYREVLFYSWL